MDRCLAFVDPGFGAQAGAVVVVLDDRVDILLVQEGSQVAANHRFGSGLSVHVMPFDQFVVRRGADDVSPTNPNRVLVMDHGAVFSHPQRVAMSYRPGSPGFPPTEAIERSYRPVRALCLASMPVRNAYYPTTTSGTRIGP